MRAKMSCVAGLAALVTGAVLLASPLAAQTYPDPTKKPAAKREGNPPRVTVQKRSFLDAGTEVLPGQRKFLDYALPPTHTPMDVVQNTGGRVGWHNSPLPGPFFPW